jgi:hypothetical protein
MSFGVKGLSSLGHLIKDCPPGWGVDGGLMCHLLEDQQGTKSYRRNQTGRTVYVELCKQREIGLGLVTWKV